MGFMILSYSPSHTPMHTHTPSNRPQAVATPRSVLNFLISHKKHEEKGEREREREKNETTHIIRNKKLSIFAA